jgi:hypothetical protein
LRRPARDRADVHTPVAWTIASRIVPESLMRERYGSSPVHLLAHLILLPLIGWALLTVLDFRAASNVVLWLVAAVIVHDAVLLPAYSAVDRAGQVALRGAINYVRVPAGLSLLMLLVFWGTIRDKGEGAFRRVSGLTYDGYAGRWLLVSAALFAVSGALYLVRGRRRT